MKLAPRLAVLLAAAVVAATACAPQALSLIHI